MEAIKWEKWGSYAIKTRNYSISKSRISDEWIYTLWKLPKAMLGNYKDINDAKKAHLEIIRSEPAEPNNIDTKPGLQPGFRSDYSKIKG
jgi:hypothetical protein